MRFLRFKFKLLLNIFLLPLVLILVLSRLASAGSVVLVNPAAIAVHQAVDANGNEVRCVISPFPHGEGRDGHGHRIVVGANLGAGNTAENAVGNWTIYE